MNGWVVIGAKLDKKELERDLKSAENDLKRYEREAEKLATQKFEIEAKVKFNDQDYEAQAEKIRQAYSQAIETNLMTNPKTGASEYASDEQIKTTYQEQLNALNDAYNKKQGEASRQLSIINKKIENNRIKQDEVNQEVEEMSRDLDKVKGKLSMADKFNQMKQSAQGLGNSMGGLVKSALKWGLALFGVRTAYNFIRNAMSTMSQYNTQLGTDVSYISFALASTLEPIIITIVNWVKTALQYLNYIFYSLFKINLFAGASSQRFQEGAKGLKSASKNAKELKKQLAGFDEMNVLQDNTDTRGGGGGGGGIGGDVPSVDLSKVVDFSKFDLIGWVREKIRQLLDWIYSIDWQQVGSNVYQAIKNFFTSTDWGGLVSDWFELLGASFGMIGGFILGFLKDAWADIKAYFQTWIDDSVANGGSVAEGILNGIVNVFKNIGYWIADNIFTPFIDGFKKAFGIASPSKVMMEMGGYIIDGLKNGLLNIWNKVKSIFENLKTNMVNIFINAWERIKSVFSGVGSFFGNLVNIIYSKFQSIGSAIGNVIGNTFKSAINAVLKVAENVLNAPIKAINGLINKVNELPGVSMSKLSTFKLPRLAKGGIINQPGRGVAIGGEAGPEAVVPLTDSQQMAMLGEAIGRYITINANIVNTMNGRVIGRELKQIQNEDDFAFNR